MWLGSLTITRTLLALTALTASAGQIPAVQLEVRTDAERIYVQQLVKIFVDVYIPRLKLGEEWLAVDPIPTDTPPKLLIPWLRGTPWLQPTRDPIELLRARAVPRGPGFRINDLFIEDVASPLSPFLRPQQAVIRFERREVRLRDGSPGYRYRLVLPFRTTRPGATVPVTVTLQGELYEEARSLDDRRLELLKSSVRVRSNRFSLHIRPLPLQGRPRYFTGAVGRFQIEATVDRKEVRVGDPILFTLSIRGEGLLDRLAPPQLSALPGWHRFRVLDEPIESDITGNCRRFTYRIRPLGPESNSVPPVLWSYFDPVLGVYQTVATEAIPLQVRPVKTVKLPGVGGAESATPGPRSQRQLHGIRPAALVLRDHGPLIRSLTTELLVLAVPVLLAAFVISARVGRRRWLASSWRHRFLLRRRVRRRLAELTGADDAVLATELPSVIAALLRVRVPLPAGASTAEELSAALATAGIAEGLQSDLRCVLRRCDAVRFGAERAHRDERDSWIGSVRRLEQEVLGTRRWPFALLAAAHLAAVVPGGDQPSEEFRWQLVRAAEAAWARAAASSGELGAARALYRDAARQYELLLASGLRNGYLLYNIGCCYLHADDLPQALYYFVRARRYIPRDRWLQANLQAVLERLARDGRPVALNLAAVPLPLSVRELQMVWLGLWSGGWTLMLAALVAGRRPLAALALVLVAVGGLAGAIHCGVAFAECRRPTVVVLQAAEPRSGPGQSYEAVEDGLTVPAGAMLRRTRTVGRWCELVLDDGRRGWLSIDLIGLVEPALEL